MAIRNIMVMFSTNVGQYARDMAVAATATDAVAAAADRLRMIQAKEFMAQNSAGYASAQATHMASQLAGETELNRLAKERNDLGAQAMRQQQMLPANTALGGAHKAAADEAIAANKAEQIASNEAAITFQQNMQKETQALMQKNLAYRQSNQQVISGYQSEVAALKTANEAKLNLIGRMSKDALLLGGVGVGLIAGTVDIAAKFQSEMSQAAAISDFTRSHLDQMSAAILRIGAVTPVSISALVAGLTSAEQAGFQGAQALAMVKLGAEGSVVGMTDAASAIQGVSTVLTGFGLSADHAVGINNILIAAVQHGLGTYTGFANALTLVGPAARAAGVSVNDAAAAVAVMTKKGMDASTAATGLGRILVQLTRQGTPTERVLVDLANATHQHAFANGEAVIKGLGFVQTLELIGHATGTSLTKMEQFVPNIRQIRAAFALFGNDGKDVAAMIKIFTDQTGLAVSAAEAYATKLSTTSGQFQIMKNNLQEAGIAIGTNFLPIANDLIKWVTSLANAFNSMTPGYQKFIEIAVGGISGLLILGGVFGLIYKSVNNLGTAWSGITNILRTNTAANNAQIESDQKKIAALKAENDELAAQFEVLQKNFTAGEEFIAQRRQDIIALGGESTAIAENTAMIELNTKAKLENGMTPMVGGVVPGGVASTSAAPGETVTPSGLIIPRGSAPIPGTPETLPPILGPPIPQTAEQILGESGIGAGIVEATPTLASRAGAFASSGMGMGLIGIGAGQLAFLAGRNLSGAPKRTANILGDIGTGAGIGAMAGAPFDGVGAVPGAIIGGAIGLGKGLLNLAQGGKNSGPSSAQKAWEDALTQQQSGVSGMGQQQLFQDFATSGGDLFTKFRGMKDKLPQGTDSNQMLSDVSTMILAGAGDTKGQGGIDTKLNQKQQDAATAATTAVTNDYMKALNLTGDSLTSLGIKSKDIPKLQDDIKQALRGNTSAASDLHSKLYALIPAYDGTNAAGVKITKTQHDQITAYLQTSDTLSAIAKEYNIHSKAVADLTQKQKDQLPVTQANTSAMIATGLAVDGTDIQFTKLTPDVQAVVKALQAVISPVQALKDAVKDPINIAINGTGDFQTISEVFAGAQKAAQSQLDATAQAQAKSINKSTSDQQFAAKAMEKFTLAQEKTANKESEAIQKAVINSSITSTKGDPTKGIIDAQLSAGLQDANHQLSYTAALQNKVASGVKVTAKEIKDSMGNGGVAQVSLREFSSALLQSTSEQAQWNANLKTIADAGIKAGIPISDLLKGLETLGQKGESITAGLAQGVQSGDLAGLRHTALLFQANANAGAQQATADQFMTSLKKEYQDSQGWEQAMATIISSLGGTTSPIVQALLQIKDQPGALSVIQDLQTKLTSPDPTVRSNAIQQWTNLGDQIASVTTQSFAVKFAASHNVVASAAQEMLAAVATKNVPSNANYNDPSGGVKTISTDFVKNIADQLGMNPTDPVLFQTLSDNLSQIIQSVAGQGVSRSDLNHIFGTANVTIALKLAPNAQAAMDAQAQQIRDTAKAHLQHEADQYVLHIKQLYDVAMVIDTSKLNKDFAKLYKDVQNAGQHPTTAQTITINADKAAVTSDQGQKRTDQVASYIATSAVGSGHVLQAFLSDIDQVKSAGQSLQSDMDHKLATADAQRVRDQQAYDTAMARLKQDKTDFAATGGDLNKLVLTPDTSSVATAKAAMDRAIAQAATHPGNTLLQYEAKIKTDEWQKAVDKLKHDTQTLTDVFKGIPKPKAMLDGLATFKGNVDEAVRYATKLAVTYTTKITPADTSAMTAQPAPFATKPGPNGSTLQWIPPEGMMGKAPAIPGQWVPVSKAEGGFINFADGGKLPDQAQIRKAGTAVQWAEPETGGEAFIPMSPAKRAGSLGILSEVARQFGLGAPAAASSRPPGAAMVGAQYQSAGPRVIMVQQKVPVSQSHHYEFGDISGPSMKDIQRYAEQKARMRSLRGDD